MTTNRYLVAKVVLYTANAECLESSVGSEGSADSLSASVKQSLRCIIKQDMQLVRGGGL